MSQFIIEEADERVIVKDEFGTRLSLVKDALLKEKINSSGLSKLDKDALLNYFGFGK